MKAIVQYKYGDENNLEMIDVQKPVINEKEILAKVHVANIASGDMRINTLDVPFLIKPIMRLIFGLSGPRNIVRGVTASGEITEIGSEVTKFNVGDRVYFINSMKAGCLAEYIKLNEKTVMVKIPNGISYEQAAPMSFGAMTALHFLNSDSVRKNMDVLIYGASGSVGTSAVQIAKYYGATVTAVSSKKNHDELTKIGADYVIDYKTSDFRDNGKQYDIIMDAVGKIKNPKPSLKDDGTFYSVKMMTSEKVSRLETLNTMMTEGKLVSVIDSTYKFDEFKEAHKKVYGGHKLGNVVIKITEED